MAKQVVKWQAEDGKIYDTHEEALAADVRVYKEKADKWDELEKRRLEEDKHRRPYHERGGHQ